MFVYHELYGTDHPDSPTIARVIGAIGAAAALLLLFAFAPRHDPTKVVNGAPCSVLSEAEISAALGSEMRMMPTSGAVCRYVPINTGAASSLFVIARHDPMEPASIARDGVPVHGVGDEAVGSSNGLYVRYGSRSYTFIIVPQTARQQSPLAAELRLAKMVNYATIAQTR